MATFEVKVKKINVFPHPDPEVSKLEIGQVDDYKVVVGKGLYKTGDLVAYIPEQSLVPANVLEEMNLVGKLAGSNKNRVKAIKLRGCVSQGLCYPAKEGWAEGQDVTEVLGITKWLPSIPVHLAGDVGCCDINLKFDIENIKKYPNLFQENEDVVISEKVHGTFCMLGFVPEAQRQPDMINGKFFISSKGLGARGNYLKDCERNANNVYIRTIKKENILEKFETICREVLVRLSPIYEAKKEPLPVIWLLGEVYGRGVQDLQYGLEDTHFRAFASKIGNTYLDYDNLIGVCLGLGVEIVPILYRGPYSKEKVAELTDGKTVAGNGCHIREGVVVCSAKYRETEIGRPILKSVSNDYLLRKDKNATEFE